MPAPFTRARPREPVGRRPDSWRAASFLVFAVVEFSPGNVARKTLGPFATEQQVRLLYDRLQLGDPVLVRYGRWMGVLLGLVPDPLADPRLGLNFHDPRGSRYLGNLGYSTMMKAPVADVLWDRLLNSLLLAGLAASFIVPLALLLGIVAGVHRGRWIDRAITVTDATSRSRSCAWCRPCSRRPTRRRAARPRPERHRDATRRPLPLVVGRHGEARAGAAASRTA